MKEPMGSGARYLLYGFSLDSDFAFTPVTQSASVLNNHPDLVVKSVRQPPFQFAGGVEHLLYTSPFRKRDGQRSAYFYRLHGWDVLRFTDIVDFFLQEGQILICPAENTPPWLVELRFLGDTLALWLEKRGLLALHASAVAVENRAVAFLAHSQAGKTTLAASLMQLGHALLADDIFAIQQTGGCFYGRPAYPNMRMWPEQAQYFIGQYAHLQPVTPAAEKRHVPIGEQGFGSFCPAAQSLRRIYLPIRRDPAIAQGAIVIEPLSRRQALLELLRCSFTPRLVEAAGLAPARLAFLTGLAGQIPVRRLLYPAGFEHLPAVRQAILQDLESDPT